MNMEQPTASSNFKMPDLQNISDTANTTKGIGNESSGISGLEATPNNS